MASKAYEIFHSDGGHGGPYMDLNVAESAAKVSAKRQARIRDCGIGSARIAEYDAKAPGGFRFIFTVSATRCSHCAEIHCCVS